MTECPGCGLESCNGCGALPPPEANDKPIYMKRTEAAMLAMQEIEGAVCRLIDTVRDEARLKAEAELDATKEALREIGSDARWIVAQVQRVPDQPINTVAKAIVDRIAALTRGGVA